MTAINLSLVSLPIELVHRILDNLDDLTILMSLRNVCSRLNLIIDTYHRYQTLTMLNIANLRWKSQELPRLYNLLLNNTILVTLDLAYNRIGDEDTWSLANTLKNKKTLKTLVLDLNHIGEQGTQYLADGLENNKALTTIQLGYNAIGAEGTKLLSNAL
ncbi:unnamed protein product [Rotaria magnacalcarata]